MKYTFSLLVVATLLMSGCGTDGKDGTDGTGETPKVYYFDIKLNQFMLQGYNSSWVTYSFIKDVTITDMDLVMVFVNLSSDGGGDNYWQAMPHNEYVDNYDFFIEHSFGIMGMDDDTGNNNYLAGDIMFSLRTNTGDAPYNPMNSTSLLKYNVYIIKGTQGKSAKLPESVDKNNRFEVEEYCNKLTNMVN